MEKSDQHTVKLNWQRTVQWVKILQAFFYLK